MSLTQFYGVHSGEANAELGAVGGTTSVNAVTVNHGTYSFRTAPATTGTGFGRLEGITAAGGSTTGYGLATISFNSWVIINTLPAANFEEFIAVYTGTSSTTLKLRVVLNSAGTLAVYDSTATLVATGTTVLSTGVAYRIDVKASTGVNPSAYEVRINEVVELTGTCAQLNTNCGNTVFGKSVNINGQGYSADWGQIWVDNVGTYAPHGYLIDIDLPTANGTTMSWTGGTAPSDYTQVNEQPYSATNYVSDPASTSLPVVAEFAMQTFAQMGIRSGSTIYGLKTVTFARDNTAIANTYSAGLRSGSTTSMTTSNNTGTGGVTDYDKPFFTDPATGLAWTQSGVENVQIHVEEGTTAVNTRCMWAAIMIASVPPASTTTSSTLSMMGVG